MDVGVGVKGYAVIEQGKIGQILSSKPTDRRQLIEEAAGVTKFKSRRRQAELKLEAAQQNLTRVDDLVYELERQRAALKRQAGEGASLPAAARRAAALGEAAVRAALRAAAARRSASRARSSPARASARQLAAARLAEVESDLERVRIELTEADSAGQRAARRGASARARERAAPAADHVRQAAGAGARADRAGDSRRARRARGASRPGAAGARRAPRGGGAAPMPSAIAAGEALRDEERARVERARARDRRRSSRDVETARRGALHEPAVGDDAAARDRARRGRAPPDRRRARRASTSRRADLRIESRAADAPSASAPRTSCATRRRRSSRSRRRAQAADVDARHGARRTRMARQRDARTLETTVAGDRGAPEVARGARSDARRLRRSRAARARRRRKPAWRTTDRWPTTSKSSPAASAPSKRRFGELLQYVVVDTPRRRRARAGVRARAQRRPLRLPRRRAGDAGVREPRAVPAGAQALDAAVRVVGPHQAADSPGRWATCGLSTTRPGACSLSLRSAGRPS